MRSRPQDGPARVVPTGPMVTRRPRRKGRWSRSGPDRPALLALRRVRATVAVSPDRGASVSVSPATERRSSRFHLDGRGGRRVPRGRARRRHHQRRLQPTTRVDASSTGGLSPTVELTLSEFAIKPASVTAAPGRSGAAGREQGVRGPQRLGEELGKKTVDLQPGTTAELDLGEVAAGHYTILCEIPGHADSGMTGMLMVGSTSMADGGRTPQARRTATPSRTRWTTPRWRRT